MISFDYDFEFLIPAILLDEGGPLSPAELMYRCQVYVTKWSQISFDRIAPRYRDRLEDLIQEGVITMTDHRDFKYTGA